MKFDILTLFPEMFQGPMTESILRRAQERVLLDGPLPVGAAVVVEGVQRLRVGSEVAPVPASAADPSR